MQMPTKKIAAPMTTPKNGLLNFMVQMWPNVQSSATATGGGLSNAK